MSCIWQPHFDIFTKTTPAWKLDGLKTGSDKIIYWLGNDLSGFYCVKKPNWFVRHSSEIYIFNETSTEDF
jgi:hypothetical protein